MQALKAALIIAGTMLFGAAPADAALLWVASTGTDAGACPQTAPCLTFNFAIGAAAAGDEIRCADEGDFGLITLAKALTIDCEDHVANATVGSEITLSTPGQNVRVEGVEFNGGGGSFGADTFGLTVTGEGIVELENITIRGLHGLGRGLRFTPNSNRGKLLMSNSTVSDNTSGNILVSVIGENGGYALFDKVTVSGGISGLRVDGTAGAEARIVVHVRNSVAAHNVNNGFVVGARAGQAEAILTIEGSTAFDNGASGAVAVGAQATMFVRDSVFTRNGIGIAQQEGSSVGSAGNNSTTLNGQNTEGTIAPVPPL